MEIKLQEKVYLFGFSKSRREFMCKEAVSVSKKETNLRDNFYVITILGKTGKSYTRTITEDEMGKIRNFQSDEFGGYAMASFSGNLDEYKRKLAEYFAWENEQKILRREKLLKQIAEYDNFMKSNNNLIAYLNTEA